MGRDPAPELNASSLAVAVILTVAPSRGPAQTSSGSANCRSLTDPPHPGLRRAGISDRTQQTTWPAAPISAARLATLPAAEIAVATSGSAQAVEQARTALELDYPYRDTPSTIGEIGASLPSARTDVATSSSQTS
jgi:hypothetical protein